ncbi:MAG: leucine-rich repeat domain-containing protein [Oscillospiraceae bacterium]|nr:leucine-rich repeat domain-containing protein [Oscillospiraceae bacterium]
MKIIKTLKENKQLAITVTAVLAVLIIFGVLQLIEKVSGKTEAEKQKERGDKYLETYDVDSALRHYKWALENDPAYEEIYIILHDVYLSRQDKIKAREILLDGAENTDSDRIRELLAEADYIVVFQNTDFEATVRRIYNLGNDVIWRSDLDDITIGVYYVSNCDLYDDLLHFRNLEHLTLGYNGDYDISRFGALPKLTFLDLRGGVLDLSETTGFTNLTELTLRYSVIKGKLPENNGSFEKLEILTINYCELDNIHFGSLASLKQLTAEDCGIEDVTMFTGFKNLEYLDLNQNKVADISPLTGLENLASLYFRGNLVSDLSVLKDLKLLHYVQLGNNPFIKIDMNDFAHIGNVAGLPPNLPVDKDDYYVWDWESEAVRDAAREDYHSSGTANYILKSQLEQRTYLNLHALYEDGKVLTLGDVKYMPNLEQISISSNISVDLSPLAELKNLKSVSLAGMADISELLKLPMLEGLYINQYNDDVITDCSVIAELTNLKSLTIYNCSSEISFLSKLTGLESLSVIFSDNNNSVPDISVLSGLTKLQSLTLRFYSSRGFNLNGETEIITGLSDISALSGLNRLNYLDLENNNISDISALSGLNNLIRLNLSLNQIADISPLSEMYDLTYLYIYSNNITDISVLSELYNLREINLSGNQITDVSPLSGFSHGIYINFLGNPITDFSPVRHIVRDRYDNYNYEEWIGREHWYYQ